MRCPIPGCKAKLRVGDSRETADGRQVGRIRYCPNHPEVRKMTVELEATDPAAVCRLMWRARERSRTVHGNRRRRRTPQPVAENS